MELDSIGYLSGKLVVALLTLATIPLLSRNLTAPELATLGIHLSVATSSAAICGAWLAQATLRMQSIFCVDPDKESQFRSARAIAEWSMALCSAIVALVWTAIVIGSQPVIAVLTASLAAGIAVYSARVAMAQALRKPLVVGVSDALRVGLPFVLLLYLASVGALAVASVLSAIAIGWLFGAILIRFGWGGPRIALSRCVLILLKRMLKYGVPMGIWISGAGVYTVATRLSVVSIASDAEAGLFTVFQETAMKVATFAFMPLVISLATHVVKSRDAVDARKLIARGIIYWTTISCCLVSLAWFSAPVVVKFLFTSDIVPIAESQYTVFIWLLIAELFGQVSLIAHKALELQMKAWTMVGALSASLLVFGAVLAIAYLCKSVTLVVAALVAGRLTYALFVTRLGKAKTRA